MSRTYLITGGAGFIGSHLCDALLGLGDRIVVVDNLISGHEANLAEAGEGCTLIRGDVRALAELEAQIPKVDAIVHLAALISGYHSLSAPDDYEDVNIRGTQRVIDFAVRRNVPRIVFASSSTVYGNSEGGPLREDRLPAPLTVYALTKLVGEHLLDLYGKMHGFSHCSLRLFNVYGPRQAPDHPYANVTCKFSHAAANGLPIKLCGDGEQSRDFVYVEDVVRAFLEVLPGSRESIYNVGTGRDSRINELRGQLEQLRGGPLETEQCGAWANDIRQIRADTSRFEQEFGFTPSVPLAQGLGETLAYFQRG